MRRGKPRLAQGNIACTHGGRRTVSTQLSQIARKAQLDRKAHFTSLAHLLTPAFLTRLVICRKRLIPADVELEHVENGRACTAQADEGDGSMQVGILYGQ